MSTSEFLWPLVEICAWKIELRRHCEKILGPPNYFEKEMVVNFMRKTTRLVAGTLLVLVALAWTPAWAQEAAQASTKLTPLGSSPKGHWPTCVSITSKS